MPGGAGARGCSLFWTHLRLSWLESCTCSLEWLLWSWPLKAHKHMHACLHYCGTFSDMPLCIGCEATTFELLASLGNAFQALTNVLTTSLMAPFQLAQLSPENETPDSDIRMANYTYIITAINLGGLFLSVYFFPTGPAMCLEWKEKGGRNMWAAIGSIIFVVLSIGYSTTVSLMGLFPSTACLQIAGGDGC